MWKRFGQGQRDKLLSSTCHGVRIRELTERQWLAVIGRIQHVTFCDVTKRKSPYWCTSGVDVFHVSDDGILLRFEIAP